MAEFVIFLKGILEEKRNLLFSLGFFILLALSASKMTLALAVGITLTLALTASSAVTALLGRYSTVTGARIVYAMIIAFTSALSAILVSLRFPDITSEFSVIAAIIPACALSKEHFSKNDSVAYASVRSLTTGLIFTALAFVLAFIREFFGSGTLFGMKTADFNVPFLRGIYGTLILCGVILAVINAVIAKKSSKNVKKEQKKSINTEADDADS